MRGSPDEHGKVVDTSGFTAAGRKLGLSGKRSNNPGHQAATHDGSAILGCGRVLAAASPTSKNLYGIWRAIYFRRQIY
jgi:hypothetical protein